MVADFAALIAAGEVRVATDALHGVLGVVVFRKETGSILLENVAVLPNAAGREIGKARVRVCEYTCRRRGLSAVRFYTNAKMIENPAIYSRLGYEEVDRRTEDGFERVYFEKRLF